MDLFVRPLQSLELAIHGDHRLAFRQHGDHDIQFILYLQLVL